MSLRLDRGFLGGRHHALHLCVPALSTQPCTQIRMPAWASCLPPAHF